MGLYQPHPVDRLWRQLGLKVLGLAGDEKIWRLSHRDLL